MRPIQFWPEVVGEVEMAFLGAATSFMTGFLPPPPPLTLGSDLLAVLTAK